MASSENISDLYQGWAQDPSTTNLNNVVKALSPSINYALISIGAVDDKLVKSKARVLAAQAVQKYDPEAGTQLPTWVSGQLMQLRRFKRQTQVPVKVPERIQLDAWTLNTKEKEFYDEHDREPDLEELSDYASIPIKRIQKIRNSFRKMPSETTTNALGGAEGSETDYVSEAMDYVYKETDKTGRDIIEMKTGYGGKYEPMEPKDIAIKLGLTPSQLTRKSAKIFMKMQKYEKALQGL